MTIQRIFQKEDSYKNFRRNILGSCIDSKYFLRNDLSDNKEVPHTAFDYGFLMAIAKIKYELSLLESQLSNNELDIQQYLNKTKKILDERLEITYGKNQDPVRGKKLAQIVALNSNRISDDLE